MSIHSSLAPPMIGIFLGRDEDSASPPAGAMLSTPTNTSSTPVGFSRPPIVSPTGTRAPAYVHVDASEEESVYASDLDMIESEPRPDVAMSGPELDEMVYGIDPQVMRASEDGAIEIFPVDPTSEEAEELAKEFLEMNTRTGSSFEIVGAVEVHNAPRHEVYQAVRHATPSGRGEREHVLWHGSPMENMESIAMDGIRPSTEVGCLGTNCVYIGSLDKAVLYSVPRDVSYRTHIHHPLGDRTVFKTRAVLGRTLVLKPGQYDSSLTRPPRGYDSVSADLHGGREFAVYDAYRVLVDIIVRYRCVCHVCNSRRLGEVADSL